MVDVIANEGTFGIGHGLLYRMELPHDTKAGLLRFQHADDMGEVPPGALEAADHSRMRAVTHRVNNL